MKKIIFAAIMLLVLRLPGQDTLKVMSYNLLNYGNITSYCTASNNSFVDKEKYLRRIINYTQPDIFAVNEIAGNSFIHKRLLDSALNGGNFHNYAKAGYSNAAGSDIVVMLYFNSLKLSLAGQYVLNTQVRDIVLYKLYYNDPALSQTHDTAYINCVVAHLKAGSSTSDRNTRSAMATNAMDWINQNGGAGDYLFLGDLNLKSSSEPAYQKLLNYSNTAIRFYDPVNRSGNWNNNSSFASVHTQSTHSSSNGCASGGGLDDRFDFILASSQIINGGGHYRYVQGSYHAVGNDGKHFNKSINSGSNNSVPAQILSDLYNMSDHLPLMMSIVVDKQGAGISNVLNSNNLQIKAENPFSGKLSIKIQSDASEDLNIRLFSSIGKCIFSEKYNVTAGNSTAILETENLQPGLYILKIYDDAGYYISRKIIKL